MRSLKFLALKPIVMSIGLLALSSCSKTSTIDTKQAENAASSKHATAAIPGPTLPSALLSHIWRIAKAPAQPPLGSIFVFLPNGTLLETSCVETYRIATWTTDEKSPRDLRVVEDGQLAFTASIAELTDSTLRLRKHLVRGNETQDVTLTAVDGEFVCPDMPK